MQITATNLRRDLFQVFDRAKAGEEVLVSHKGTQFRIAPEEHAVKLDRIQPVQVMNPDWTATDEECANREMWAEIEADWNEPV